MKKKTIMAACLAALMLASCDKIDIGKKEKTTTGSTTETTTEITKNDDTSEDVSESVSETNGEVELVHLPAYVYEYIDVINEEAGSMDGVTFGLIHIDDDNIPELVSNIDGYWVSVYTYSEGELKKPIDSWGYGVMGNHGYYYKPFENMIYNSNADYAGALQKESSMKIDESGEIAITAYREAQYFDEDADPFDTSKYLDGPILYLNGEKTTEEEYDKAIDDKDLMFLGGSLSADEAISMLESSDIPKEHTYEIVTADMTWSEFEALAESKGGHLVTLNDEHERAFVAGMFMYTKLQNNVFLIGGSLDTDGTYKWTTDGSDSKVPDEYWLSGEPSFEGKTESGATMAEDKVAWLYIEGKGNVLMDVPDDILEAAPSYSGYLSCIIEYE